jgi:hypothetical protein
MPTQSGGAETMQAPITLRNLVETADHQLVTADVAKRERWALLDPLRRLADDFDFWQHQAGGLALFSGPEFLETYRVGFDLDEDVSVGRHFRIRPLLPAIRDSGSFYILALTENTVRLFEATSHNINELGLGPIPESESDALWFEDPERQLQMHRSGGETQGGFHGHGLGEELRKERLERYFRLIDEGIHQRVGHTRRPLILACVAYYEPIFRAISSYPVISEEIVEGSPERLDAERLHAGALPIMGRTLAAATDRWLDRYRELAGTGTTATGVEETLGLAAQGRVDILLVPEGLSEIWGSFEEDAGTIDLPEARRPLDDDLVDIAAIQTIEHGGTVILVPASAAIELGAILRF